MSKAIERNHLGRWQKGSNTGVYPEKGRFTQGDLQVSSLFPEEIPPTVQLSRRLQHYLTGLRGQKIEFRTRRSGNKFGEELQKA